MDIDVNQDEQIQVSLQKELEEIKEELKKEANTYKAELRGIKSNAVQRIEEMARKELEKCVFGDGDLINSDGKFYVPEWAQKAYEDGVIFFKDQCEMYIKTLEGDHHASVGDYIIRGVNGELYPCKPDIFEKTYDIIDESNEPISLDNVTVTFKGEPLTEISIPILKVRAEVRYFEDGMVNGENDISYEEQKKGVRPRIPCVERNVGENLEAYDMWSWCLEIDPNSGFIRNWPLGFKASVHYKVCDGCHIEYIEKGKKICDNERDGYVPDFLCPNGEGYGDYMIMEIDGGFIQKWNFEKFAEWVKIASRQDEE